MGTIYHVNGSFPAKQAIGQAELDKIVAQLIPHYDQREIEIDFFNGRSTVTFRVGSYMGYSSVSALDDALTKFFNRLADFAGGVVTYDYEYENERGTRFYGPETMCLAAYIASARQRIEMAKKQIEWATNRLKKAKRKKVELDNDFLPASTDK